MDEFEQEVSDHKIYLVAKPQLYIAINCTVDLNLFNLLLLR